MPTRRMLTLLIACLATGRAAADEPPTFDPTDHYRSQTIEGWTVRVSNRFEGEEPKLLADVLAELRRQLVAIKTAVPAPAIEDLRKVEIWAEVNDPLFPCMCYHPDERWLRAHGVNPRKTGHVELANARNFLSWTRHQPWMVMHELAHGYHDRFLTDGYANTTIAGALAKGKGAGRYGEVDHVAGSKRQHYAATNPMEYFAEGSEAYFGKNDFYPFDRKQLREYDPELVPLLEELWRVERRTTNDGTTEQAEGHGKE
ncbi:MAG: metallopeptidase [Planctomycetaceae bacterium]